MKLASTCSLTAIMPVSVSRTIIEQIKRLIPPLDGSLHKGQSGQLFTASEQCSEVNEDSAQDALGFWEVH